MSRFMVAMVIGLGLGGAAHAADAVEGVWQTKPDDNGNFGHIEIKPCGPAFCGTLVRAFDGAGAEIASPNIGRQIVWDMAAGGGGAYGGGDDYGSAPARAPAGGGMGGGFGNKPASSFDDDMDDDVPF